MFWLPLPSGWGQLDRRTLKRTVLSNLKTGSVHQCHQHNDDSTMCTGFLGFVKRNNINHANTQIGERLGVIDLTIINTDHRLLISSMDELLRRHNLGED